jgi:hypothetical protein
MRSVESEVIVYSIKSSLEIGENRTTEENQETYRLDACECLQHILSTGRGCVMA